MLAFSDFAEVDKLMEEQRQRGRSGQAAASTTGDFAEAVKSMWCAKQGSHVLSTFLIRREVPVGLIVSTFSWFGE